jgi:hypothetical protein
MLDQEPKSWEYDEPTDWQAKIMDHIIVINHELGDVVRDISWVKTVMKIILVILVLLSIAHGPEMIELLSKALDLLA